MLPYKKKKIDRKVRLSVKMQRVVEYDVERCFQTSGMSARIRRNI